MMTEPCPECGAEPGCLHDDGCHLRHVDNIPLLTIAEAREAVGRAAAESERLRGELEARRKNDAGLVATLKHVQNERDVARDDRVRLLEEVDRFKRLLKQRGKDAADAEDQVEDLREALRWALAWIGTDEPRYGEERENFTGATRLAWPDAPENWAPESIVPEPDDEARWDPQQGGTPPDPRNPDEPRWKGLRSR